MEQIKAFGFMRFITVIGIRDIFLKNLTSPYNEYMHRYVTPYRLILGAFTWDETPEGVSFWGEINIAWINYCKAADAKKKSEIIKEIHGFINSHISNETNYYTLY